MISFLFAATDLFLLPPVIKKYKALEFLKPQ